MTFLTNAVMSSNLVSISEDRDVATAEALMKVNRIRHLPVVDMNNELSGIVSIKDIARAHSPKEKIKTVMSPRVRVVKKSANIKTVIEQMLKYKISSVLVAQEQEIVGIVTTDDLIKLLFHMLDEETDMDALDEMEEEESFDENLEEFPNYPQVNHNVYTD